MIESGIVELLTGDTGVVALVDERIFPLIAPQGTVAPFVVYQVAGRDSAVTVCGQSDFIRSELQLDSLSKTYALARSVADSIRDALVNFTGELDGVLVHTIRKTAEFDFLEQEPGLYRVSQNYSIWHK